MEYTNAVGRRKASIARVFMSKGSGKITVNGVDYKEYFPVVHFRGNLEEPAKVLEQTKDFDIMVNVQGGGKKGQSEAIRLAIARGFVKIDPENKPKLKAVKLLTRDARVVERKKPGLRKARKRDQFSKR